MNSINAFFDLFDELNFQSYLSPQIDCVYHYTNLNAFISIVDTSKGNNGLWLSNARFLNDADEIQNGKKFAIDVLKEKFNFSTTDIDSLESNIKESAEDYYICSFCGTKDSLDQWRSYSQNGKGICIEFCFKTRQ